MTARSLFLAGMLTLAGCSGQPGSAPVLKSADPQNPKALEGHDILHITWGGIAMADAGEEKRHWSTWTINLIDGSAAYGWQSDEAISFPHTLDFELAGAGKIRGVVLDSRFEPVIREDGSSSQSAKGSAVRRFALLGSTKGPDGPFEELIAGEAQKDVRSEFPLPKESVARWLRLRVDSNWAGSGATRLSELAVIGELDDRGSAVTADVSGVYSHEYGPIMLRQTGNEIRGCYSNGLGTLRGTIFGRVMRLAWFSAAERSIGAATLVAANGKLYGFWYQPEDKMGSPWNATRTQGLDGTDPGPCRAALYPSS